MRLHHAPRRRAQLGPAVMMRPLTIILALMLVLLGVLAAHHAQTPQGTASHAVLAELEPAQPPINSGAGASPDIAGEHVALGLATGCIVLIACCVLGLALLTARAWRADLYRLLSTVVQPLREYIISAAPIPRSTRPSLVALSISRT